MKAPLSDTILIAIAKLIDDSKTDTREPSHSDLAFKINAANLRVADPAQSGQAIGKAKRIRAVLSWALENNVDAGENLVSGLISLVRGCGGFRTNSPNYVGESVIETLCFAFKEEGYDLGHDGSLQPIILDSLSGTLLTEALNAYVRRAKRGIQDAALVTGTSKDLLEATSAHIITEIWGSYSHQSNFPQLLGQAFTALKFATPANPFVTGDPPQKKLQISLYETACSINTLRNKQGTGHGRPWLPAVSDAEAKVAVEMIGCIAELMLASLPNPTP